MIAAVIVSVAPRNHIDRKSIVVLLCAVRLDERDDRLLRRRHVVVRLNPAASFALGRESVNASCRSHCTQRARADVP
jgi:hypothetical protein